MISLNNCKFTVLCLVMSLGSVEAWASTGDAGFVGGNYEITPSGNGTTAEMQVAGIRNTTANTTTGSLGFELWYSSTPYSGGTIDGFKVAESYLPIGNCTSSQLGPGQSCTAITVTDTLTVPPAGTYYPVLLLVEFSSSCPTNGGYCIDDYVDLTNLVTGGPTVTVGSVDDGGSGSTGNAEMAGPIQVSGIDWTADTVDITAESVTNIANATSGSLAIQLWFMANPYTGGAISSGYKIASFPLPASCTTGKAQLNAGMGCSSINSGTIAVTPPPAGTYYAAVVLVEYNPSQCPSNAGYCVDNGLALQNQETVPDPITIPGIAGTDSGGGGGGLKWLDLLALTALMAMGRLWRRRMPKEFTVLNRKIPCRFILLIALIVMPQLSGAAASAPAATPPSTPPPSSSAAIESQVLAFKEADQLAAGITTKVCDVHIADGSTIVIYDQASFASLQSFEAFVANIKVLTASYETLIPDLAALNDRLKKLAAARRQGDLATKPAELAEHLKGKRELLALGPVDPFSDLTALLSAVATSSNVETPSSVVIPDSSIAIALTSRLRKAAACPDHHQPFKVIYPPLFGRSSTSDFASADLEVNIQILQDVRQFAHEVVYANVKDHSDKEKPLADAHAVLTKALTDIDGLYDNFMNALLQPNAGSGVIGSASVIQGIRLTTLLRGDPNNPDSTYILLASVVGAGGTERVHKTLWTALGSGDKITYSGGLITNVAMWKSTGGNPEIAELMYSKSAFQNADGATHKD